MVFFGILELMGRNWNQNIDGRITFSVKFLRKNLKVSSKRLQKVINFTKFFKRISSELKDGEYTFYCQEFHTLLDNWSDRGTKKKDTKLGSNSVVTTQASSRSRSSSSSVVVATKKEKEIKDLSTQYIPDKKESGVVGKILIPKILNPNQLVVEYYKYLKGFQSQKGWDLSHYKSHVKHAQSILRQIPYYPTALKAMEKCAEYFEKSKLAWTLATVARWIPEYLSEQGGE